jgi:hypothetical protein
MRASSRTQLPTRLPDYAPGRILAVGPDEWTLPDVLEPSGVLIELPRYALDLRTLPVPIDPARVRRLLDGSAVRPLETRPVELSLHAAACTSSRPITSWLLISRSAPNASRWRCNARHGRRPDRRPHPCASSLA